MMTIDVQTLLTATIVLVICFGFLLIALAVTARIVDELNERDYKRVDRFITEVKIALNSDIKSDPENITSLAGLKIVPTTKRKTQPNKKTLPTKNSISMLIRDEVGASTFTQTAMG